MTKSELRAELRLTCIERDTARITADRLTDLCERQAAIIAELCDTIEDMRVAEDAAQHAVRHATPDASFH